MDMSAAIETLEPRRSVLATYGNGSRNRKDYITLEDGSIVLSPDDLAVLGDGDPKRGAKELRRMIALERDRPVIEKNTARPASVRLGTQTDEAAVFQMLMEDVRENAAMVALPDRDRLMQQIGFGRTDNGGVVGLIDAPAGGLAGVCILLPMQWWWSRSFFFQELVLYVSKEHRTGTRYFQDLIAFEKWWVEQMTERFGYKVHLLTGVLGTRGVRKKAMAYRRWFRIAGFACIYPAPIFGDEP